MQYKPNTFLFVILYRTIQKIYFRPFGPLNKYFKDYFPIELIKTADLDPHGKYLLCSHPHGAMPAGINIATATNGRGKDKSKTRKGQCGRCNEFKGNNAQTCPGRSGIGGRNNCIYFDDEGQSKME